MKPKKRKPKHKSREEPQEPKELSPRRKLFVERYLVSLNATKAATEAEYSPTSAHSIGQELLTIPEVQAAIQAAMAERSKRTKVDQDFVVKRLAALANSNLQRVATWESGSLAIKASADIDEFDAYMIDSIKIKPTDSGKPEISVKMRRPDPSLHLLSQHLGLLDNLPDEEDDEMKKAQKALDEEEAG